METKWKWAGPSNVRLLLYLPEIWNGVSIYFPDCSSGKLRRCGFSWFPLPCDQSAVNKRDKTMGIKKINALMKLGSHACNLGKSSHFGHRQGEFAFYRHFQKNFIGKMTNWVKMRCYWLCADSLGGGSIHIWQFENKFRSVRSISGATGPRTTCGTFKSKLILVKLIRCGNHEFLSKEFSRT